MSFPEPTIRQRASAADAPLGAEPWLVLLASLAGGALAARLLGPRPFSWSGKVVLVAGGSRGLGLVLARECAAAGARVALCARNAVELLHARDDLLARGAEASAHRCDVRDRGQVASMASDVLAAHGRIDVLVNCAGIIEMGPVELMDHGDWEDAMATHFWGSLHTVLAVLPAMRARGEGADREQSPPSGGRSPCPTSRLTVRASSPWSASPRRSGPSSRATVSSSRPCVPA